MTTTVYSVPLGKNSQELVKRGTPLFPCSAYKRDVHQYITGEIPPHWHRELEMFLLDEGCVRISLIDCEFDLQPGEGYFVNSNVLHGIFCRTDSPCRYRSIVFDPIIISGAPGSAFDMLYIRPFIEQGASVWLLRPDDKHGSLSVTELFDKAHFACESEPEEYEFSIRDALSHILLSLKERSSENIGRPAVQQELRMKQMLSWIDEHYSHPITVSQLADAAGICVRECQRYFSDFLHDTPMQYLTRRRITAAADLLASTDLPVTEVGMCCGFETPSYFAKQFKMVIGATPREYRYQSRSLNSTCRLPDNLAGFGISERKL